MPFISPLSNKKLCIESKRRTPPPKTIKGKIRVSALKLKGRFCCCYLIALARDVKAAELGKNAVGLHDYIQYVVYGSILLLTE